jgi:hypothetical protein
MTIGQRDIEADLDWRVGPTDPLMLPLRFSACSIFGYHLLHGLGIWYRQHHIGGSIS